MGALAVALGQPLMPWQQQVADVGLELLPDGRPAYRSVAFTVPRQSGKTTIILLWELQRALGWAQMLGRPQQILYSAQDGTAARQKLLEDQVPLLEPHRRLLGVTRVLRTNGNESVSFANGSRIGVLASRESSGHGKTLDLGVQDELFADADMRRDQAMRPAMATRPHAQIVIASTMGTMESLALNAAVSTGRQAVETDRDRGVAYFEWSASPDDEPGDPATWRRCMPALGHSIDPEVVEQEYASLPLEEFKRAFLNIQTTVSDRVIPLHAWNAVCVEGLEVDAQLFAVDVSLERDAAAIVAVGAGPNIEVVDYRPGVAWFVDRCAELSDKHGVRFAFDGNGPAGSFLEEFSRRGIPFETLDAREVTQSCGLFFDRVIEGKVAVRSDPDIDRAVAGAARRSSGESWAWGRKASGDTDISLLMAASIGAFVQERASVSIIDLSAL